MNCVAAYLKDSGKSQRAFAIELSVSQPTVHAWVTGAAKPDNDNIAKISEAIGIAPEQVFLSFFESGRAA
jgi:transcriptional regulator with XRE-family HTH domain